MTDTSSENTSAPRSAALSRRHALTGVAGLGLGLPLLAACGSDSGASGGSGSGSASGSGSGGSSSPSASGTLGAAADVPVGGGRIYADAKVVVTQPTEGDFRAFSAVCTHQGCPVTEVTDGAIECRCHGSTFSIEDGSVQSGPATRALGEVPVTVTDGEITAG